MLDDAKLGRLISTCLSDGVAFLFTGIELRIGAEPAAFSYGLLYRQATGISSVNYPPQDAADVRRRLIGQ